MGLQADVARIDPTNRWLMVVLAATTTPSIHSRETGCICHFADQGVNGPDDSPFWLLKAPG